jgi:hypothetical protein
VKNQKRNLKDHVVIEDGIPRIRPINRTTGKPMVTEKEAEAAITTYMNARKQIDAARSTEHVRR